jgi:hypothetical protein
MILRPTPVPLSSFTFVKEEGLLVAEDSSLPRPSRVYDDACAAGYTLVSHHTGREVVYVVNEVVKEDGDLLYWTLIPAARRDRGLPNLRVFND